MMGEIRIESENAPLLERMMVEEKNRSDLRLRTDGKVLSIVFNASGISDARAMVNTVINDISCAEKLLEV